MVTPLCWSLGDCIQWISNMLQQKAAVGFEKLPEALRQPLGQRFDGFIDDQPVPVPSPCSRILRRSEAEEKASKRDDCAPPRML